MEFALSLASSVASFNKSILIDAKSE